MKKFLAVFFCLTMLMSSASIPASATSMSFSDLTNLVGATITESLSEFNCTYFVSGDTMFVEAEFPSTRKQVQATLLTSSGRQNYESFRDLIVSTNNSIVDLFEKTGHSSKNYFFEIATTEGFVLFSTYNKDIMFDLSTYEEK